MDQLKLVGILLGLRPKSGSMGVVVFKTCRVMEICAFGWFSSFNWLCSLVNVSGNENFGEDIGGFLLNLKLGPELEVNSHNLKVTMAGALDSLTFIRVRHNAHVVRSTCPPLLLSAFLVLSFDVA